MSPAEVISVEHEGGTYRLRQTHPLRPYTWVDRRNTEAPRALAGQLDYILIHSFFGDPNSYSSGIKARRLEKRVEFILRGVSVRRQEKALKRGLLGLVTKLYPAGTEDKHLGSLDIMNSLNVKEAIEAYEKAFDAIPYGVYFCMMSVRN